MPYSLDNPDYYKSSYREEEPEYYDDGTPKPRKRRSTFTELLQDIMSDRPAEIRLARDRAYKQGQVDEFNKQRLSKYDSRKKAAADRDAANADMVGQSFQTRLNEAIATGAQPMGPALTGTTQPLAKMSLNELQTPGAVDWQKGQSQPMTEPQARAETFNLETARRPQVTPTQVAEAPMQAAAATQKAFEPEKPKGEGERPSQSEIREKWVEFVDSQFSGDEFQAFQFAKEKSPSFANRVKAEGIFNPDKKISDLEDDARTEYVKQKREWNKAAAAYPPGTANQFVGDPPTIEGIIFDPDYGTKYDALKRSGKYSDPKQMSNPEARPVDKAREPMAPGAQPAQPAMPGQAAPTDSTAMIQSLEMQIQQELQSTQALEEQVRQLMEAVNARKR